MFQPQPWTSREESYTLILSEYEIKWLLKRGNRPCINDDIASEAHNPRWIR